jgi:hypothetical protein
VNDRGGCRVTGHKIRVTGVKIKDGKLVETLNTKKLSVSERIRQRKSKKVKVAKGKHHD